MPIDRKKYHPKWKLISYLIRFRRAKNRCEVCGLLNYSVGFWIQGKWFSPDEDDPPETGFATYQEAKEWRDTYNGKIGWDYSHDTNKVCVVILTVSHLDHDEKNNRFHNLKAMCQTCHLTHDRKDNAQRRMYGPTGRHHNQLKLDYEPK
ncbi:hypothetical protein M0L20_13730 [Spirosoma sp. RP8]|uniref:HNH endonuclease n=1 Tax=Spirosoma liriopis TaxID=2937440 RepID=A0ABT0HMP6_9BACT|nr:hypothetical protein [Spirosoma liriopis]MCK8492923.1 hypothetical protein [Spirosoma liriopis]